jgi:hypothetical protein
MDESSILRLCETLLPGTHVFFDRFFTSEQLIEKLHSHEIGATGTLMKSRVPKNSKLKDPLPSPSFRRSHNGHLLEIATIKILLFPEVLDAMEKQKLDVSNATFFYVS